MARSPSYNCPICGQYMDFIATTYRKQPYIDGNCYRKMCFCCAHVPQDYVLTYDDEDNVINREGPFFDHKHLYTPEELILMGVAKSPLEAQRSCRAVRMKLRDVGAVALRKLKLRCPTPEYELNPELQEEERRRWGKGSEKKRVSGRKKQNAA